MARVVDGMLGLAEQPGNSFPLYSAEVQLVWPPCALQGQGSSVEVRTEVARICAPKRLAEPKKVFTAKLLTVRNDSVLGEELLKVDGGEALTRCVFWYAAFDSLLSTVWFTGLWTVCLIPPSSASHDCTPWRAWSQVSSSCMPAYGSALIFLLCAAGDLRKEIVTVC